jgi:hypothetical protein
VQAPDRVQIALGRLQIEPSLCAIGKTFRDVGDVPGVAAVEELSWG